MFLFIFNYLITDMFANVTSRYPVKFEPPFLPNWIEIVVAANVVYSTSRATPLVTVNTCPLIVISPVSPSKPETVIVNLTVTLPLTPTL